MAWTKKQYETSYLPGLNETYVVTIPGEALGGQVLCCKPVSFQKPGRVYFTSSGSQYLTSYISATDETSSNGSAPKTPLDRDEGMPNFSITYYPVYRNETYYFWWKSRYTDGATSDWSVTIRFEETAVPWRDSLSDAGLIDEEKGIIAELIYDYQYLARCFYFDRSGEAVIYAPQMTGVDLVGYVTENENAYDPQTGEISSFLARSSREDGSIYINLNVTAGKTYYFWVRKKEMTGTSNLVVAMASPPPPPDQRWTFMNNATIVPDDEIILTSRKPEAYRAYCYPVSISSSSPLHIYNSLQTSDVFWGWLSDSSGREGINSRTGLPQIGSTVFAQDMSVSYGINFYAEVAPGTYYLWIRTLSGNPPEPVNPEYNSILVVQTGPQPVYWEINEKPTTYTISGRDNWSYTGIYPDRTISAVKFRISGVDPGTTWNISATGSGIPSLWAYVTTIDAAFDYTNGMPTSPPESILAKDEFYGSGFDLNCKIDDLDQTYVLWIRTSDGLADDTDFYVDFVPDTAPVERWSVTDKAFTDITNGSSIVFPYGDPASSHIDRVRVSFSRSGTWRIIGDTGGSYQSWVTTGSAFDDINGVPTMGIVGSGTGSIDYTVSVSGTATHYFWIRTTSGAANPTSLTVVFYSSGTPNWSYQAISQSYQVTTETTIPSLQLSPGSGYIATLVLPSAGNYTFTTTQSGSSFGTVGYLSTSSSQSYTPSTGVPDDYSWSDEDGQGNFYISQQLNAGTYYLWVRGASLATSGTISIVARKEAEPTGDGGCWIYTPSGWQHAIAFVYVNGSWRQAQPWIYSNGTWVQTT